MTLPNLPEPAMVHMDAQGYSTPCYTSEQMLHLRAETVKTCAGVCDFHDKHSKAIWSISRECAIEIRGLLI